MRKRSCFYCGYYKKETREDGSIRHYCNDRDCTVEPHDPECNYED